MIFINHLRWGGLVIFQAFLITNSIEPHAGAIESAAVTVCQIAQWDKSKEGAIIKIEAEYFSDFRHGAILSDKRCPSENIILGHSMEQPDQSALEFDNFIGRHLDYYKGRNFKVNLEVIFKWREGRIINQELPLDRHIYVPAKGSVSILKVFSFEKPTSSTVGWGEPANPND